MDGKSTARLGERQRNWLTKRERELGALAGRQHGVIRREQLLSAGLSTRTIERRVSRGQLYRLHRSVYSYGDPKPSARGRWLAAVFACGRDALLSHQSAAALWGLMRLGTRPIEVTSAVGRGRPGMAVHEGAIHQLDRTKVDRIPVTTVARTLFDLAEVVEDKKLERAFEEADRLRLLRIPELEAVCVRCPGRRALRPIRRLINEFRAPEDTRSRLEDRVLDLCRAYDLPPPVTNVDVLGHEVDAFWPRERLIVEADSVAFHSHRAAFEEDRKRDALRQAEGFRVVRLTNRRLEREPAAIADELHRILKSGREEVGRAGS